MTYVAALIVGLLGGVVVSWGLASRRAAGAEAAAAALREQRDKHEAEIKALRESLQLEQSARSAAQATLEAERRNLDEQRSLLRDAESKLREAFTALSAD